MRKIFFTILFLHSFYCLLSQDNSINVKSFGVGNTKEEAITNALTASINNTYGFFVSNEVSIVNDSLKYDKMNFISKGIVDSYKFIDETILPNGSFSVTLDIFLSLEGLSNYFKKVNGVFQFNSQSFSYNLKLQQINKLNESNIISQFSNTYKSVAKNAFDFKLRVTRDLAPSGAPDEFSINYNVQVVPNINFKLIGDKLLNILKSISLSKVELAQFKESKTKIWSIAIKTSDASEYLFFRNEESIKQVFEFCIYLSKCASNFVIENGARDFNLKTFQKNNAKNIFQFFDQFPLLLTNQKYSTIYSSFYYNRNENSSYDSKNPELDFSKLNRSLASYKFESSDINNLPYTFIISDNFFNYGVDLIIGFNLIKYNKPLLDIKFYEYLTLDELKMVKNYQVFKGL